MKSTIIALATPPGVSAIAAIRVSGPAVPDICKALLPNFNMQPRTACLVNHLIAIYFPAPNSYTGEDILELFPHGNPFIIRSLMESICKIPNVRLAGHGEFTERAFLNGKMDLTQAEAVGDILQATNSKTLNNAHRLLSGEVSSEIKALAENIKKASALMELEVDFAEDNVGAVPCGSLHEILRHLQTIKKRFKSLQSELPRVAIFGAPNAGKSSLINALLRENRLLVSEQPGTTRDFVEVPLHLPSGNILLIDTAGLAGKAQNEIDILAMQKSQEVLEKANLKILAIDSSAPLPPEFKTWANTATLIVWTHIDISCKSFNQENHGSDKGFKVASPRGEGIKELIDGLDNIFFPKTEENEEPWITSERQIACIKHAEKCVAKALELTQQNAVELAAFEMREARNALCSLTGEISDESILNAIFSSYCIGK